MPKYRVKLNIGSSTKTEHIEAKSVQAVLDFFSTLTVAKVTEVLKVEYELTDPVIQVDDMLYHPLVKIMLLDTATKKSRQLIFHYLKPTKDENDIIPLCKSLLEVDGSSVKHCYSCLIKS